MNLKLPLIAFLVGGWISVAEAQTTRPVADISPTLARAVEERKLPGMVAVVIKGGRIVGEGAAGVRKKGDPTPVTIDDPFHVGSCAKAMTATICGLLVEDGKLRWDITIGEVFPEWREKMHPSWRNLKLDQLLTHRSGAPADTSDLADWMKIVTFDGEPQVARQMLFEAATTRPVGVAPDSKFIYSNLAFAIAGHMAEKVTAKSYETLMRERIFLPLGMKTFGFGAPGTKGKVDAPWGHTALTIPIEPGKFADNTPAITPAGTMHFAIRDWAKFVASHWPAGPAVLLVKPETLAHLHKPAPTLDGVDYAPGWVVMNRPWAGGDGLTFFHNGTNSLWYAVVWCSPARELQLLIVTNRGGPVAEQGCDDVATALVEQFVPELKPTTVPATAAPVTRSAASK